jgi:sulfatase maturation enzyme AslB (radical SAM superfamily)
MKYQEGNLVVLYDGRDHSDVVLRATNWLEHSGKFKLNILYVKTKRDAEEVKNIEDVLKEREYLDQARVEFNEIPITAESNSSDETAEI